MIIKKDCYYIPESVFFEALPLAGEYGVLYMCYYIGAEPTDILKDKDEAYFRAGFEFLKNANLLQTLPGGVKVNSECIIAKGTAVKFDFIEEARKKAELKIKSDKAASKMTADTLYAIFNSVYINLRGVDYKENPLVKEKALLSNMIKEYGPDRASFVVEKAAKNWKNLSNKPLTIENLYNIRANIPYNPAWRMIDDQNNHR